MNRPFRAILILATLMIIGVAMIPLLSVQYKPSSPQSSISIGYSWPGASAKVVEAEITSKIEGIVAPIVGVSGVNSRSSKDGGEVTLDFKKGTNVDALRFEVSSRIRSLYPNLPKGVSYPTLSAGVRGDSPNPILTYTLNADISTWDIQRYAQEVIVPLLSAIDGVENISVSGATPHEWIVEFDSEMCDRLGVTSSDISNTFRVNRSLAPLGITDDEQGTPQIVDFGSYAVEPENWQSIEVKNVDGHIVTLGNIATISRRQQLPNYYNRINGLNNINLTIYPIQGVNNLSLASKVKACISSVSLPEGYSVTLAEDSTEYIKHELTKIYTRTGLSVLILLLFVFIASRSWRYLLMIVATLTANILIAFIFYALLDIELHLYSLAGITVSLGMIIDTSIIMLDHYSRFGNRRVFTAILAALLTTIGALSIVYFLPDDQRQSLVDFSLVIIINLSVSLLISFLFIPALLDRFPLKIGHRKGFRTLSKRRIVRLTTIYGRYISWGRRHLWVFIILAVLGFGIPVQQLPMELGPKNAPDSVLTRWQRSYNNTIGGDLYQKKLKKYVEPTLGGSLRLFARDAFSSYQPSEPERTTIHISASLPPGCNIHQLNATMLDMENYLSQFPEIDIFRTSIYSYDNGNITVTFTPEAERAGFAFRLQELVTSKVISLGGADWSVRGVGRGFSNSLNTGWKSYNISISGYNYDQLYKICEELLDSVSVNPRVTEPIITGGRWNLKTKTEFYLNFNFDRFVLYGISPSEYFTSIGARLHNSSLSHYYNGAENEAVVLASSTRDKFDVWHLSNDMIRIGNRDIKLSELGSVKKTVSGNDIFKRDQQYSLSVAYDFVGSYELRNRMETRQIERLQKQLPVGYKVYHAQDSWWWGRGGIESPYSLLVLIAVIIFFICAVLFESLRQPLVIISLIPISFIGVFLTFSLFELPFDQGGFASFVLLSGLVVNAGIYLINEYNTIRRDGVRSGSGTYLRCYNRKIVPIILTVLSTVLGLLPFVVISREPFWFSFAAGAMGGMIFSMVAILLFLPLLLPFKK